MKHLLPVVPKYFKTNLHTHTTVSDGKFTPEEVKELYKSRGYSAVAFTDHEVCIAHPELNDPDFLALTSYELENNAPRPAGAPKAVRHTYHLNFLAKDPENRWQSFHPKYCWGNILNYQDQVVCDGYEEREYSVEYVNSLIAKANTKGFLVTYNHPAWSQQSYPDYAGLKGLWATEVFNNECYRQGYDDNNAVAYHTLLQQGNHLFPVATDDFHSMPDENAIAGGWVMVGAKALTYAAMIDALEKGDFYASTGPEILGLTLEDDILTVTCSEAVHVDFISHFQMAKRVAAPSGQTITQARFNISKWAEFARTQDAEQAFFRVTVTDKAGHIAYTRAYWLTEL